MSISVTRTTVVRVHQELDELGCRQLDRILTDLIDHQGIRDLIVDISEVDDVSGELHAVLARALRAVEATGGALELRTRPEPSDELLAMIEDIPTFTPIEPSADHHP